MQAVDDDASLGLGSVIVQEIMEAGDSGQGEDVENVVSRTLGLEVRDHVLIIAVLDQADRCRVYDDWLYSTSFTAYSPRTKTAIAMLRCGRRHGTRLLVVPVDLNSTRASNARHQRRFRLGGDATQGGI